MPLIITAEAVRFAQEVGVTDIHALKDITCGMHSGFPKCCILFFISVWRHYMYMLYDLDTLPERTYRRSQALFTEFQEMLEAQGIGRAGYIPCPRCQLEKNIVKVKTCNCRRQRTLKLDKEADAIVEAVISAWVKEEQKHDSRRKVQSRGNKRCKTHPPFSARRQERLAR